MNIEVVNAGSIRVVFSSFADQAKSDHIGYEHVTVVLPGGREIRISSSGRIDESMDVPFPRADRNVT